MLKTVLFLLLAVFSSGSHQQCFSKNDAVYAPTAKDYYTWLASTKNFSIALLKALNRNSTDDKNVIFSPWSIREALLLAYFGAAHQTEASLAKVLQIPAGQKKALTWKIYHAQKLMNLRKDATSYPVRSVNKLYLSNKLSVRRCMKAKFEYELESININSDVKTAANKINHWVEKETGGQIKLLLKYLNPYTTSALVNAIAFKAKWNSGFNPDNTQSLRFTSDGGDGKFKPFMVKGDTFDKGYSKELRAHMLLLPHEANRTGMIIILPDENLNGVIQNLDETTLDFITNKENYQSTYLKLIIPKFDEKSNVHIETVLERLGIGNAFTVNADFSGFTGKKNLFITEVVHEASVQADEEGSIVSTATGVDIERRAGLKSVEAFICDHPFLYIMYDFQRKKIILMGTYKGEDNFHLS